MEYLGAARRFIRAAGRRVAEADEYELRALADLRAVLDEALQAGVDGQRATGRSWAAIGAALGTSKQAAYERFGPKRESAAAPRVDPSLPPPLDLD
ncbi:hypothetical protein ABIQ69_15405 [Agromyces sp. G08B096]|uniref:Uncharacterized protein n=1 Tax=Agromyces sp. G08B096 TaxID=3156399 RepID=A0AAU7W5I0_9MICO